MASGLPAWLDDYWRIEPDIPRTAKGIRDRVNRLKALGNAVVPKQAYPIFRAIMEIEGMK
jgi:DNA (cytosine-5)-methyltransferase 1